MREDKGVQTKVETDMSKKTPRANESFIHNLGVLLGQFPVSMSECEKYGMSYGCDGECPVFIAGDCKCVDEDPEGFRKAIKETDRFSNWEISELNDVYPQLKLQE